MEELTKGFRLGGRRVDPVASTVQGPDGGVVRVEPKAMRVLVRLAREAGRVVPKEALFDSVWGGRAVTDDVLTGAVSALRKALGDSPKRPHFIQTVSGEGYRLVAAVDGDGTDSSRAEAPPGRSPHFPVAWVAAFLVAAGVVALAVLPRLRPVEAEPPTVAVLPFANLSGDPGHAPLADGLTDWLITNLAHRPELRVISRTSVLGFGEGRLTLPEIARALGADLIVEGTVLREGDRVRISAQLVDGPLDRHLWAREYDRSVEDLFGLFDEVSLEVAREVADTAGRSTAGRTAGDPVTGLPSLPAEARELYLQGRAALERMEPVSVEEGIGLLRRVTEMEPGFAPAWTHLAEAFLVRSELGIEPELSAGAMERAARRAVEAAPGSADAHRLLGAARLAFHWDFAGARRELGLAAELAPGSAAAHRWFGGLLAASGEWEGAIAALRRAELLDPLGSSGPLVGVLLWRSGRPGEAEAQLRAVIARASSPSPDLHRALADLLEATGRAEEAVEQLVLVAPIDGGVVGEGEPGATLAAFHERRLAGLEERAASGVPVPRTALAETAARAGRSELAFDLLDEAVERRELGVLYTETRSGLWRLWSDERHARLRERVGAPDR